MDWPIKASTIYRLFDHVFFAQFNEVYFTPFYQQRKCVSIYKLANYSAELGIFLFEMLGLTRLPVQQQCESSVFLDQEFLQYYIKSLHDTVPTLSEWGKASELS